MDGWSNACRILLDRLIGVTAETKGLMAAFGYRFEAVKAYWALVDRCIQKMRESRLSDSRTLREFMRRRFALAMRPCRAMTERANTLG